MPLTQQKIDQAKKMFGVSDTDIQRIVSTPSTPQSAPPAPQEQQPQGGLMDKLLQSRALPIAGSVVGGGVGAMAGGVPGIAGAVGGYGAGDVIRKELSNLLGVKGKQSERTVESVGETAKGAATAGIAQGVGQIAGYALKLIKPGIVTNFLAQANDMLAKKGFGTIPNDVLETRFMNEVIPKALRFTQGQGEDVVAAGENLVKSKITPTKVFDSQELNFLRKNLNAIGEGADGMKKALIDGLAKVVREEQIKLAPQSGVTLPLQQTAYQVPEMLKAFWPTRMAMMGADAIRGVASGIGSKLAKFGGGPLIGGALGGENK